MAFEERGYTLVSTEYVRQKEHLLYICNVHPESVRKISYDKLLRGQRCTDCVGKRILTFDIVNKEFEIRGFKMLDNFYINSHNKIKCKCLKHPDQIQYISYSNFYSGKGCKYCKFDKMKIIRVLPFEKVKQEFEKNNYILLTTEYINARTKMEYVCKTHPDTVQTVNYNNLQQGRSCRFCGIVKMVNALKLDYEYVKTEFEKRGYTLLDKEYKNSSTKMSYICPFHPDKIQRSTFNNIDSGQGCPICGQVSRDEKRRRPYEVIRKQFEDRGFELLEKEYKNTQTKMKYRCLKHPEAIQEIIYSNFYAGCGCRICNESTGEKEVRAYLINNDIIFIDQYSFPDCRNDRSLRFDFAVFNSNNELIHLIEYDGEHHYRPIVYSGNHKKSLETFEKVKKRDKVKDAYCEENNIQLIRIPYWEKNNLNLVLNNIFNKRQAMKIVGEM